ncbi:hypothetical protein [Thalassoroseus pseudoceratinae]|uniref:hypothetical protein n=1 Tax=Thalassoroseus pseudoceratinae TaxID=2713176 RepID=UPI00141E1FDF|nr:hypothetical protein [Thalassoroseus pseudoceratinae]
MAELLTALESECPDHSVLAYSCLRDAIDGFEKDGVVCDLGLVLHTVPGEHQSIEVLHLLSTAPLTRWLVVNGVWCESVARTETTWPLAFQVPLRLLHSRLASELAVIAGEKTALAATAGRDEAFEFNVPAVPIEGCTRRVAVRSPDPAMANSLSDLLAQRGAEVVGSVTEADAMVVDVDNGGDRIPTELQDRPSRIPVIGVQSMTTFERTQELKAKGFAAVVPKLAMDHRLLEVILAVTQKPTLT